MNILLFFSVSIFSIFFFFFFFSPVTIEILSLSCRGTSRMTLLS